MFLCLLSQLPFLHDGSTCQYHTLIVKHVLQSRCQPEDDITMPVAVYKSPHQEVCIRTELKSCCCCCCCQISGCVVVVVAAVVAKSVGARSLLLLLPN